MIRPEREQQDEEVVVLVVPVLRLHRPGSRQVGTRSTRLVARQGLLIVQNVWQRMKQMNGAFKSSSEQMSRLSGGLLFRFGELSPTPPLNEN